jgi:hypothetical protein
MNGNVSKEGITLDREWMKRVGVGGVQMFDAIEHESVTRTSRRLRVRLREY